MVETGWHQTLVTALMVNPLIISLHVPVLCDLCLHTAIPLLRLTPLGGLYNVTVGDPFTLQCTAEGNQPITSVEWVKVQGNQQSCK